MTLALTAGFNDLQLAQLNQAFQFLTGITVKEGSNLYMGTVALVGGAAVVSNNSVTATSRILLTSQVDGGTPGWLRVSARVASTSFTITSSSGTDTSTVAWIIFTPA